MAYKRWSKKKIKEQLKYLKARYDYTKDERYLTDIKGLQDVLSGDIIPFDVPFTFQDRLEDDAAALELYYDFLDDIEEFSKRNAEKFNSVSIPKIDGIGNLTPSLLFSFLKEFFYEFDEEFGKVFDIVYAERFNNLMFSNGRSISFHLPTIQYTYINITKNDTVDDFINAVHEYTHAIVDYICYREPGYSYPFCELVSMFMEMIAADYMTECYLGMETDLNTIRLSQAKNIVVYAENVTIEKNYFYTVGEAQDRKVVIDTIQTLSGKSRTYINKLLDKTAMEKLSYTIPYLTAIELYYLYISDKERCVELVKYLIYVKSVENYNVDLNDNGIVLNEHSDEWMNTIIQRKKDLR